MDTQQAQARTSVDHRRHAIIVGCEGCQSGVTLDLDRFTVETAAGCIGVTYADTDIVVWECPTCSTANAEVLTED